MVMLRNWQNIREGASMRQARSTGSQLWTINRLMLSKEGWIDVYVYMLNTMTHFRSSHGHHTLSHRYSLPAGSFVIVAILSYNTHVLVTCEDNVTQA